MITMYLLLFALCFACGGYISVLIVWDDFRMRTAPQSRVGVLDALKHCPWKFIKYLTGSTLILFAGSAALISMFIL